MSSKWVLLVHQNTHHAVVPLLGGSTNRKADRVCLRTSSIWQAWVSPSMQPRCARYPCASSFQLDVLALLATVASSKTAPDMLRSMALGRKQAGLTKPPVLPEAHDDFRGMDVADGASLSSVCLRVRCQAIAACQGQASVAAALRSLCSGTCQPVRAGCRHCQEQTWETVQGAGPRAKRAKRKIA